MIRLLATLGLVVAALALLDAAVPRVLESDDDGSGRVETFANVVFRSFEEANRSVNASVSRAHRAYEALPDAKPDGEIRVFVIGNSAGLFSVGPEALERRLAAAYPRARIRLTSLLIPDAGVVDQDRLVAAALRKQADLILLLPNLKGLILGREIRMRFLRDLFADPGEARLLARPGDALRRALLDHWRLYRHRDELREGLLARTPLAASRRHERESIEATFREIAAAAARRDVSAILRLYRERGLEKFVPAGLPQGPVPEGARVFRAMRRTAERVRVSGALGVAVFLPVNPLYRDAVATAEHPQVRVDDATLRRMAQVSLDVYQRAGFATSDQLDALPPEAFIDLVHANAEGMRRFTEQASLVLLRALRAFERRAGRTLTEGDPPR